MSVFAANRQAMDMPENVFLFVPNIIGNLEPLSLCPIPTYYE